MSQQTLAVRQVVRRGIIFQAAVALVLAFVVGLIHVAPVGKNLDAAPFIDPPQLQGFVEFHAYPWGTLSIDGEEVAVSPVAEPLEVDAGEHTFVIENEFYEPIERTVEVTAGGDPVRISVDFEREGVER